MRNTRLFGIFLLTLSLGCLAGRSDASSQDVEIRKFSGQQEFLAALSVEVARLKLKDVQVHRRASGKVVGVTFRKRSDIAKALRAVGGASKAFKIADKTVTIKKLTNFLHKARKARSATADVESTSIAALSSGMPKDKNITVCDPYGGNFCTYNSTYNDHYTVFGWGYHDVSSGTTQTQGGYQQAGYESFYREALYCSGRPGYRYCPYEPYCNSGDKLSYGIINGRRMSAWCSSGQNELSLTNFYFANIDGRPEVIHQEFTVAANTTQLSLGHTTFGKFIFPCRTGACVVDGICARHSAYGSGGSTNVTTAAGSYDYCE